ncbi:MAG: hypothetical protein AAGJ82_01430 [Bacteroidota bacterium]
MDKGKNQQGLPPELAWEQMEEGILTRLDELAADQSSSSPKRYWFWLGLLLLTGIFAGYWLTSSNPPATAPSVDETSAIAASNSLLNQQPTTHDEVETTTDLVDKLANTAPKRLTVPKSNLATTFSLNKAVTSTVPTLHPSLSNSIKTSAATRSQSPLAGLRSSRLGTEIQRPPLPFARMNTPPISLSSSANYEQAPRDESASVVSSSAIPTPLLPQLPTEQLISNSTRPSLPQKPSLLTDLPGVHSRWSVALAGGANYWQPNTSLLNPPVGLKFAEEGLLGYNIAANVHYDLTSRWQLSSGIDYVANDTRFDYNSVRDTSAMEMVTYRLLNASSGEVLGLDSVAVEATGTVSRRLVAYNAYRQWSVPVIVTYNWLVRDRLKLGVGLGLQYTVFSKVEGRTLLTDATQEDAYLPVEMTEALVSLSGHLSWLGQLRLNYQLADRWSVNLATQVRQGWSDIQTQSGITSKPRLALARLGLQYQF